MNWLCPRDRLGSCIYIMGIQFGKGGTSRPDDVTITKQQSLRIDQSPYIGCHNNDESHKQSSENGTREHTRPRN